MIDAHVHVWDLPDNQSPTPGHSATVETLLAEMDGAGVERAVLVQPSIYGTDHGYLESAVRSYPDRFSAVGLLDPFAPDGVVQCDGLMESLQPSGVRFHLKGAAAGRACASGQVHELCERLARYDLTLSILTSPAALPGIGLLADRHAALRIVVDHLGLPEPGKLDAETYRESLAALSRRPNIWLKLSAWYALSSEAFPFDDCVSLGRWAVDRFGAERVVWGSDFPYATRSSSYAKCVRLLSSLFPNRSAPDYKLVASENARRLWR